MAETFRYKKISTRLINEADKEFHANRLVTLLAGEPDWTIDQARTVALEELDHALANNGPGWYCLKIDKLTGSIVGAAHLIEGKRSASELWKIYTAPYSPTPDDLEKANEALQWMIIDAIPSPVKELLQHLGILSTESRLFRSMGHEQMEYYPEPVSDW